MSVCVTPVSRVVFDCNVDCLLLTWLISYDRISCVSQFTKYLQRMTLTGVYSSVRSDQHWTPRQVLELTDEATLDGPRHLEKNSPLWRCFMVFRSPAAALIALSR